MIEHDLKTQFVMPLEDLNTLLKIPKNKTITKVEIVGRGSTVLVTVQETDFSAGKESPPQA